MQWSKIPDLSSDRRLAWTTLVVGVLVTIELTIKQGDISRALGDTDDAMRLVLVRDLMHGTGWYDQLVTRLQPPVGVWMHWSRLLDGALAGMTWLFHLVLPQEAAENLTRRVWPALLCFPAVGCALLIARRLGGPGGVLVAALIFVTNIQVYEQFTPGRIDHHNVQIVMTLVAAACAVARERRAKWAIVGGIATGLGLAIGLEALLFQAIIGASYGVRAILDTSESKASRNYAFALAVGALSFYGLAAPPSRWSMSFCDALGLNLIAAVTIAAAGLFAFCQWGAKLPLFARAASMVALGLVAVAAYVALDPMCLRGPFAGVDPRLFPIWFDSVEEIEFGRSSSVRNSAPP